MTDATMGQPPWMPQLPKIDPLALSMTFMALRVGLLGLGLTDRVHVDGLAQQYASTLTTSVAIGWMIVAKVMDHFHKKALANAVPGTVKGA